MGNQGINNQIEEVYGVFCGEINQFNAQKLVTSLTIALEIGVKRVHLLFHSWGGFVGDAVFIYNLFRTIPLEVIVYNTGQVASAGVLCFLGTKNRRTTANAVFMIHRSHISPQAATVEKLKVITEGLILDDARSDAIFKENIKLPDEILEQLKYHDVHLSGGDGVKFSLASEISEFAPPKGAKVFNVLA